MKSDSANKAINNDVVYSNSKVGNNFNHSESDYTNPNNNVDINRVIDPVHNTPTQIMNSNICSTSKNNSNHDGSSHHNIPSIVNTSSITRNIDFNSNYNNGNNLFNHDIDNIIQKDTMNHNQEHSSTNNHNNRVNNVDNNTNTRDTIMHSTMLTTIKDNILQNKVSSIMNTNIMSNDISIHNNPTEYIGNYTSPDISSNNVSYPNPVNHDYSTAQPNNSCTTYATTNDHVSHGNRNPYITPSSVNVMGSNNYTNNGNNYVAQVNSTHHNYDSGLLHDPPQLQPYNKWKMLRTIFLPIYYTTINRVINMIIVILVAIRTITLGITD